MTGGPSQHLDRGDSIRLDFPFVKVGISLDLTAQKGRSTGLGTVILRLGAVISLSRRVLPQLPDVMSRRSALIPHPGAMISRPETRIPHLGTVILHRRSSDSSVMLLVHGA